jgi:hypothetical protein
LFALSDWATSRKKQAIDPKPDPSWGDPLGKVRATQEMKEALDAWVPCVLTETDADCLDHPTHVLSIYNYKDSNERRESAAANVV